ncbi:MAG: hypothetical protein PUB07_00700 [Clostridia bacterium]|nr:hypothetical protein [Clostridia bacterium]
MSEQIKRLISWIACSILTLAVCVSLFLLIMNLSGAARIWTIVGIVLVSLIILIIVLKRNARNEQMVGSLLDILYKNADPAAFIAASEKALEKTKNKALRCTLMLNLAVGYEAIGDFSHAIAIMKQISVLLTDRTSKAIYYCNLAGFYAQGDRLTDGLGAYKVARQYYEKCKKKIPNAYFLYTRGLLFYTEAQYEDAMDSFKKVQTNQFQDRHAQTKLQLYMARTFAAMGKTKDAREYYSKVLQRNTYPYLLTCAKQELDALQKNVE